MLYGRIKKIENGTGINLPAVADTEVTAGTLEEQIAQLAALCADYEARLTVLEAG